MDSLLTRYQVVTQKFLNTQKQTQKENILPDHNNSTVLIVSILLTFRSSSHFSNSLEINPRTPIPIDITVTAKFFSNLAKSRYLLCFHFPVSLFYGPLNGKNNLDSCSFFLLINTTSGILDSIWWFIGILKSQRIL